MTRRVRAAAFVAPEENTHAAILMLLQYILPPGAVVHHSPNEGKRGPKAQAKLAKLGTRAGWPDIEIVYRGRVMFIEVKKPDSGRVSPAQRDLHALLRSTGCPVLVVTGAEQVRAPVAAWIEGESVSLLVDQFSPSAPSADEGLRRPDWVV